MSIQVLHCLVLGLFGTQLDILDLLLVLGILFVNLVDLALSLVVDALLRYHNIVSVHVSVDSFTLGKRLLTLYS